MSKEIRTFLEKAKQMLITDGHYEKCQNLTDGSCPVCVIDQALLLLKQQPIEGEFTKKYREKLKKQYPMCHKNCSEWPLLDRLDSAEARLKELLEKSEDLLSAIGPKGYFPSAGYTRAKALRDAVAKAKKVRE